MEVVVDSNALRSTELRTFLGRSRRNKAVLTDYSAMEAYKNADPIAAMQAQMKVVSDFPDQVIILKGTTALGALRGRKAGLRRRMIDGDQTSSFPEFCRQLRDNPNEAGFRKTLQLYGATARSNIDAIGATAPEMTPTIVDSAKIYSESELRIIRTGGAFTDLMTEKFMRCTLFIAAQLHKGHPHFRGMPTSNELPNTLLFRVAVCVELMVLQWAEVGRVTARPETVRNDMIDMNFAAIASFFDGFLTEDQRARWMYDELKATLPVIIPAGIMP